MRRPARIILSYVVSGAAMSALLWSVRFVAFAPLGPLNFFEVGICVFCGTLLGARTHELMTVLYGRRIIAPAYAAHMMAYGAFLRLLTALNSPGLLAPRGQEAAQLYAGIVISYLVIAGGVVLGLHAALNPGTTPAEAQIPAAPAQL